MDLFLDLFNFNFIISQTIAIILTALLIPHLRVTSLSGAIMTAVAISWINSNIWNDKLFFSLPDSFSLQTLIIFSVNGLIFLILVKILPGIEVTGIWPAVIAPIVFTVVNILIKNYGDKINWLGIFTWIKNLLFSIQSNVS